MQRHKPPAAEYTCVSPSSLQVSVYPRESSFVLSHSCAQCTMQRVHEVPVYRCLPAARVLSSLGTRQRTRNM